MVTLLRALLIAAALFVLVSALRYRIIRRPVITNIFDNGKLDLDVAGIDYTHKIAEDTLSTAYRSADGIIEAQLEVANQSNMATQYSMVAHLKSGPREVYEKVRLNIADGQGESLWHGPVAALSEVGEFQSILTAGESDELHLVLEQSDLNLKGAIDVEFDIYANPLGASTDPHKNYPREPLPRRWREEPEE